MVQGIRKLRVFAAAVAVAAATLGSAAHAADVTVRELSEALFNSAPGVRADFGGKDLGGLDLAGLDFKSARLIGADLYGADLTEANLAGTDLSHVRLDRVTMPRAEFASANMEGASILRPSAYSGLAPDWREAPSFRGARMAGVHIFGRFDYADFRWTDMTGAKFHGLDPRDEQTSLAHGSFKGANFSEAILKGAHLGGSNFLFAKFVKADLSGANLRDADMSKADLTGADLTGADVTGADLDEVNVSGAKGLDRLIGLASAKNAERMLH